MKNLARLRRIASAAVAVLLVSLIHVSPAAAHGGGEGDLWHHWAWEDLPLLAVMTGLYILGVRSLWRRAGIGSGISRGRAAAFGLGMLVLFIALVSPLDPLSDQLLAAHMVQHLLLVLVAAPFFVIGRFPLALAWALPARWTSRIWKEWGWKQAWKFLTRPIVTSLLHIAALWVWHMPRLYDASVRNEWLHFLEHMSFFLSAFLFWQVFAELTGNLRLGGSTKVGVAVFAVFAVMFTSGFLGVLITFSPHVWYSVYMHETPLYGLTALEDQQLAGTIMWVPAGVIYVAAAMGAMARWLFAMESLENPQAGRI